LHHGRVRPGHFRSGRRLDVRTSIDRRQRRRSGARKRIVHAHYDDIISRIDIEPIWFDEHAVPRYCEFAPERSASIYVSEVALAEITCQGCGRLFRVAFSRVNVQSGTVAEAIRTKTLHYGDPPNVECCITGASMNSQPRRVIEYWHRHHQEHTRDNRVTDVFAFNKWVRDHSLEVSLGIDPDEEIERP
jgi:hypothetical protein